MNRSRSATLNFVDIVVIAAVCVMMFPILLRAANALNAQSDTTNCLNNLGQIGEGCLTFAAEHHGYLPYPTHPLGDSHEWIQMAMYEPAPTTQISVPRFSKLTFYTQCPLVAENWDVRPDGTTRYPQSGNLLDSLSYKMNANLRHWVGDQPGDFISAKVAEIPHADKFVMIGDGISVDYFNKEVANSPTLQFDCTQLCMDVNMSADAGQTTKSAGYTCPALRHEGLRCNIVFVDGHAESVQLPTMMRILGGPGKVEVKTFQSEYLTPTGQPAYLVSAGKPGFQTEKSAKEQGLVRNPNMPLYWSDLPTLTHP